MNLIKASIERPIAVLSAVLMVVMFGLLALKTIPVQLAPDVRRPILTVATTWPGAAPAEIEREIVSRQEEVLKGAEGLAEMTSLSRHHSGEITLEFAVGTNMDRALLLVANRLDRVSGYPEEADEPVIQTAGAEDNPIAWIVVKRKEGNTKPIHEFGDFAEDYIRPAVERVEGVSLVNIYGGSEREMRVVVNADRLAAYQLTVSELLGRLRQANVSLSAGDVEEGKRRYIVRAEGELVSPEAVASVVVRSQRDPVTGRTSRVTVGDVAEVGFAYRDPNARIRHLGEPALAFNAVRANGANVIGTMEALRQTLEQLNNGPLAENDLYLRQVYDETIYIDSAISLVKQNIYVGGALAALMLMLFLRSFGATFVISVAIPVSVVGSFVAMAGMGRSINVISLAGLAFAVGMVVDAAIVVLENIYRLRQQGVPAVEAAYRGASEVWGAVFVSALTTVMVFVPLLVMELEVGQLFRDIAVAISVSVTLSLFVAVTLIPAMSRKFLSGDMTDKYKKRPIPVVDQLAGGFTALFVGLAKFVSSSKLVALGIVIAMTAAASFISYSLLPKLEYLPEGNRNLIFGFVLPPPGYNLDSTTQVGKGLEEAVDHLWADKTGPESEPGQPPKIDNFFFVSFNSQAFVGASSVDASRTKELLPVLQQPLFMEPGTFGLMMQPSIFGRGIGGTRAINLDISGSDLNQVYQVAQQAAGVVFGTFPREQGHQMRPQPGLELGEPEVRLIPDRLALADNGLSTAELGISVDTFNDGLRVAEVNVDGKRIDLMLQGEGDGVESTQAIGYLPVVTRDGTVVPVAALAEVEMTNGPSSIRRLERQRTVTLEIVPAEALPLEAAMEQVQEKIIGALQAQGLPGDVSLRLSGTADQLTETWNAMVLQLLVALVIVYLVMAVLFESFVYPLVILFSVPLAAAGAILGLGLVHEMFGQKLDMLTMLGFVILIGIVVNNAILLVHQTLHHLREDNMSARDALLEATRNRIRPIFMSTLTSVFGMLPLVLFPGAGSELYRGLGSVVVGGLSLSAVLTLLIVPALLTLLMPKQTTN
jgi:HAE1 family hydrophobic/amphiphilic exporter-1